MPTILRVAGLRFVVYPNDHPPAQVHVIGPGWTAVVKLHGPVLREVIGPCGQRDARRVLEAVAARANPLLTSRNLTTRNDRTPLSRQSCRLRGSADPPRELCRALHLA